MRATLTSFMYRMYKMYIDPAEVGKVQGADWGGKPKIRVIKSKFSDFIPFLLPNKFFVNILTGGDTPTYPHPCPPLIDRLRSYVNRKMHKCTQYISM